MIMYLLMIVSVEVYLGLLGSLPNTGSGFKSSLRWESSAKPAQQLRSFAQDGVVAWSLSSPLSFRLRQPGLGAVITSKESWLDLGSGLRSTSILRRLVFASWLSGTPVDTLGTLAGAS